MLVRRVSLSHICSPAYLFAQGLKVPSLKQAHRWWQYDRTGQMLIDFFASLPKITPSLDEVPLCELQDPLCGPHEDINRDHCSRDRFMDAGNDGLLDIDFPKDPREPTRSSGGLPIEFVKDLCLRRTFTKSYEDVNFDQALTGLDYLRDLEVTRRTTLSAAAKRLGINEDTWRDVLARDIDAKNWVCLIQTQEPAIETYYSRIFIDLRIWVRLLVLGSNRG
jgi:hypothetical protein